MYCTDLTLKKKKSSILIGKIHLVFLFWYQLFKLKEFRPYILSRFHETFAHFFFATKVFALEGVILEP